jgi:tetratricopeptide (TPR) repeat protein
MVVSPVSYRPSHSARKSASSFLPLALFLLALVGQSRVAASLQKPSPEGQSNIVLQGMVRDASGQPVAGASVLLSDKGGARLAKIATKADGSFAFPLDKPGTYNLRAEKGGQHSTATNLLVLKTGDTQRCDLVLLGAPDEQSTSTSPSKPPTANLGAIQLADEPNFTVAGVTDWSNAGLHGSDTRARTSDELARETLALKSADAEKSPAKSPNPSYDAALQYRAQGDFARARDEALKSLTFTDTAATHLLLGDLDEKLGQPLESEREFERATRSDPSEQSYLEWGAELLLHKAPQAAQQVFEKGSSAHPDSAKLLAGLGAALYAAGSYQEAAQRLCAASDLNPTDPAPYIFLGEIETSAPESLPCAREKLERFTQVQPSNARANYYYGSTLWKEERASASQGSPTHPPSSRAQTFLETAVKIDNKFVEAYVQLGRIQAAQGNLAAAEETFKKAIAANPNLSEAHYELSRAYKRNGQEAKAHQEFQAYQAAQKAEAAAVDRQRRDLRQFLIILKDQPNAPEPPAGQPH